MSIYSGSVGQPRRQSARYYDYPARHGAAVSHEPRVDVYEKELAVSRHYPDSDRERRDARIVRSRPIRTRDSSPEEDYERTSRGKSLVIRPRSTSRVRLREPASVIVDSSSDDEGRRRRRDRDDNTHIRATSRPGKKNQYAFVRTPSKGRRKSDARATAVHDLELKTDRRHRHFQHRRDDMENTEASVLVRARSRDRGIPVDDDYSSDEDIDHGRRRRSKYKGETRRKRGSLDDGRREIVVARNDRDHDDSRRRARDSKRYSYGTGLVVADEEDLHTGGRKNRRRRVSLSPDRDTVTSSRASDGLQRASTVTSRDRKNGRSLAYDDRAIDDEMRKDARKDSAYFTDGERRVKDREREAIDREKRAIEREKAALDREELFVDRERRDPPRDVPNDRRRGAGDYLKQGDQYIRDGQRYYQTGQGLLGGMKNLFT